MPASLGIIAFFAIEGLYLCFINNLEAGFLPALIGSIFIFVLTHLIARNWAKQANAPATRTYSLPLPMVFAAIKGTLRRYRRQSTCWRIDDDSPMTGDIRASFQFFDNTWRDMRSLIPEGRLERLVTLDVYLTANADGTTTVLLRWDVYSPVCAGECYAIIDETSREIHNSLSEREVIDSDEGIGCK